MAESLNRVELLRLARLGATSRIEELRREIVSLEALLGGDAPRGPSRGSRRRARKVAQIAQVAKPEETASSLEPTTTAWSPAARRAVSLRMKKYWAARRQAKKR